MNILLEHMRTWSFPKLFEYITEKSNMDSQESWGLLITFQEYENSGKSVSDYINEKIYPLYKKI